MGIEISFESPGEVLVGKPAEFVTTLTNKGKLDVKVCIAKNLKENVFIFKDGTEVWSTHGRSGGAMLPTCEGVELDPGESTALKSSWTLVDNDLIPVEPDLYSVGVSVGFSEDSNGLGSGASLRSDLQELIVRED